MKKTLILAAIAIVLMVQTAAASKGVVCLLSTYQKAEDGTHTLAWSDSVHFAESTLTSGFMTAFSCDIRFTDIDTGSVKFELHIITLDKQPHNYSQRFTVEYGLPAMIDNIAGKNDSRFQFTLTPLRAEEYDSTLCQVDHRDPGQFKVSPSANTDIYCVPNSFGDYYWTVAKSILEEKYTQLSALYKFNLPGKYNIYLTPCALKSVIWDRRFGMSVDPTRNSGYAIYNWNLTTFDPFVLLQTAVMRNFGYSPIFLTEGLASYVSYSELDMKKIVADSNNIGLEQLLDSYEYLNANAYVADKSSASFTRYLVRQYGFDRFSQWYQAADEINQVVTLQETYAKSVSELEREWLHYIDTLTLDKIKIVREIDLAEALFDFNRMLFLAETLRDLSTGVPDSIGSLVLLKRAYFNTGDYYRALETQEALLTLQNTAQDWMGMGLYRMMSGDYEKAYSDLLTAQSEDTTSSLIRFNLALNTLIRGDTAAAIERFKGMLVPGKDATGQSESRVILGKLLKGSEDKNEKALAATYFSEATATFTRAVQAGQPAPVYQMWLGISFLGSDDTDNAYNHLQTALYLEQRPFYLGMINLWLGKLADLTGDRKAARDFYGAVLANNSAAYHQAEAQQYIETAFSW
ncbi:MAG: tetratricopeptide repeat protein [bacterium]|nr:tetratricopeptide repeat protein [bacterium]